MIDIKLIRQNREEVEAKLRTKEPDVDLSAICRLDEEIRNLKTRNEQLKAERNEASKEIGKLKRDGKDPSEVMNRVSGFAEQIHAADAKINELENKLNEELASLPNIPSDEAKVSQNVEDNVIVKEWGQKREFDFEFKNHLELSESLKLFDFPRGAKISGTGWPVYRGQGARLEWALINYMIDTNIKNGFEMMMVPLAVKRDTIFCSSQLPKFEDQQFHITDKDYDFFLIPTSEVSLNGLHIDEIIPEEQFPIKYCAYTPCFRREAGAAGEKERGLIRVHQFNKVEMFCFTLPEQSREVFDMMCASAEEILQGLGLHYRNALLVTGDMSFAAAYTVDIEVWLPGQNRYYEVSSVSNCTDFQSRRSKTRFRKKGEKPELVHTLNGSGLATSRLMVSLLENNQNPDGTINIPEVLQSYMGGKKLLTPENE
jgi:seryl-tRNA synthetase